MYGTVALAPLGHLFAPSVVAGSSAAVPDLITAPAESAVPGVPPPRTGETVRAYVVAASARPVTMPTELPASAENPIRR